MVAAAELVDVAELEPVVKRLKKESMVECEAQYAEPVEAERENVPHTAQAAAAILLLTATHTCRAYTQLFNRLRWHSSNVCSSIDATTMTKRVDEHT